LLAKHFLIKISLVQRFFACHLKQKYFFIFLVGNVENSKLRIFLRSASDLPFVMLKNKALQNWKIFVKAL